MDEPNLITTINGKQYRVRLIEMEGRPVIWVRVRRELANGEVVWAFLSHRQHKVEAQARRRFAKEINEHLAKYPAR